MTKQSISEEDEPVVLDTLPAGGVSMDIIDTLNEGDVFDIVGPLVMDTHTDRITHLNLVLNNTHHFVGWNPTNERWEQIVVVEEQEHEDDETVVLKTAISIFDDETGEPVLVFDGPAEPSTKDIAAFVWEYVEHTNPNTDHLYNDGRSARRVVMTGEVPRGQEVRETESLVITEISDFRTTPWYSPRTPCK